MNDERTPQPPQGSTPPPGGAALFAVDPAIIEAILALPLPPHPGTTFDEAKFHDLLARSYSLTLDEKKDILASVPKFSQQQIDELTRILSEERVKFAELNEKHLAKLKDLEAKHAAQWDTLQERAKEIDEEARKKKDDEDKAAAIRDALGGE